MVGMDSASLKTETQRYNILILVFYNYWVSYKNALLLSHLIQVCSQMASLERTSLTILSKEYDLPLLSSLLPASFFTAILLDIAFTCLLTLSHPLKRQLLEDRDLSILLIMDPQYFEESLARGSDQYIFVEWINDLEGIWSGKWERQLGNQILDFI